MTLKPPKQTKGNSTMLYMKEVEFIARVSGGELDLTDSQQAAKYAPTNAGQCNMPAHA